MITPTSDTVIRYGSGFATSQKIAGDEKIGWRELGSTDIGLYRVANAVALSVQPKLFRSCATVDLVGKDIVVYGRMADGTQTPTAEYRSRERTVRGIATGIGANGNYLRIDSTTDAGDSGAPWVYGGDRVVAVTHSSTSTADYGSRFCDVAQEIEPQVTTWGDTLTFVEDLSSGGSNGHAGTGSTAMANGGSGGGRSGTGGRSGSGGAAGSGAGSTMTSRATGGMNSGTTSTQVGGTSTRLSNTSDSGSTAPGGRRTSLSNSVGKGGVESGSGIASGGTAGSAIQGARSGGANTATTPATSEGNGGTTVGDATRSTGTGGTLAHAIASETDTVEQSANGEGCACALHKRSQRDLSIASALLGTLLGLAIARRRRMRRDIESGACDRARQRTARPWP